MTGQETIQEALRQMIEGEDYTPLQRIIEDLTPEQATQRPANSPYTIATIAWHIWFWNHVWVTGIRGDIGDPFMGLDPDSSWPDKPADEWPGIRDQLLASLQQSAALAKEGDLERVTRHSRTAGQNLLQVAIHTAYHIGQIALVRQELGLWPPAGGD